MKSGGDFEDILAEDTPAVWQSHRPAKGGDAGAMLAQIIERAAKLKTARRSRGARTSALHRGHKGYKGHKGTKTKAKKKARRAAGASKAKAAGKPIRKK